MRKIDNVQIALTVDRQRRSAMIVVALADRRSRRPFSGHSIQGSDPNPKPLRWRIQPRDMRVVAKRYDLVRLGVTRRTTAPLLGKKKPSSLFSFPEG